MKKNKQLHLKQQDHIDASVLNYVTRYKISKFYTFNK